MKSLAPLCAVICLSTLSATSSEVVAQQMNGSISSNSAPVITNNQIGRDLTVNYQGWDINRQPVMRPFVKTRQDEISNIESVSAIELLVEQIKRDKEFSSFLLLFTGATGRVNLPEAEKQLDDAVEKGSGLAAMMRATVYRNGYWGKKDPEEAKRLVKVAAERGDAGAQGLLAESYWQGTNGYEKNLNESTKYVEKLANNEKVERKIRGKNAMFLAYRFTYGEGAKKDVCLGIRTYATAANLGNLDAMLSLGYERENENRCLPIDKTAALTWFERAAAGGDSIASAEAGRMHQHGFAGTRNFLAAERFYVASGIPFSDRNLAWLYAKGLTSSDGIPDYIKAVAFAKRAADADDGEAMLLMGIFYEYGMGVQQNHSEAFRWYGKAASNGELMGRVNQAINRINGCVGDEEMPSWLNDLIDLSEKSNVDIKVRKVALLQLGLVYRNGKAGIKLDQRKATIYMEQSCTLGNDEACAQLVDLKGIRNVSSEIVKAAERANIAQPVIAGEACARSIAVRSKNPDWIP